MANADVFNRRPLQAGASFAADSAAITFSGGGLAAGDGGGLLVQNIGLQYTQPVTRLYELGSFKTYYVAGRPQGNGNFGRILGPGTVVVDFYYTFGDVCKASQNIILIFVAASCGNPCFSAGATSNVVPGIRWCVTGIVLTSVAMSIAAQDMIMNENLGMMFVALEVCEGEQQVACWPNTICCNANYSLTTNP